MDEGQVVPFLFLPTNQQTAKAIHPGMRSLHNPMMRSIPRNSLAAARVLPASLDVVYVVPFLHGVAYIVIIITLVETEMLWCLGRRIRTLNRHTLQRLLHQPFVVGIGAGHHHAQRDAISLGQHAALRARFRPIRGVWTRLFPPRAVPW